MKEKFTSILSFISSTATLLCCALPALLTIIAGGAAVGTLISAFPWLVPLSQNKGWVFLGAGALLSLNAFIVFRPTIYRVCNIREGKGCKEVDKFNKIVFGASLFLYLTGAFMAYALVPIFRLFR